MGKAFAKTMLHWPVAQRNSCYSDQTNQYSTVLSVISMWIVVWMRASASVCVQSVTIKIYTLPKGSFFPFCKTRKTKIINKLFIYMCSIIRCEKWDKHAHISRSLNPERLYWVVLAIWPTRTICSKGFCWWSIINP